MTSTALSARADLEDKLTNLRNVFIHRLQDPEGSPFETLSRFFPSEEICRWFDVIEPDQFVEDDNGSKWLPVEHLFAGESESERKRLLPRFIDRFEYLVKAKIRHKDTVTHPFFKALLCLGLGLPAHGDSDFTLGMDRLLAEILSRQQSVEARQFVTKLKAVSFHVAPPTL